MVEVADSTLAFDLNTKAALYARAGIPEYWVLDVKGQRLMVHRDPSGGRYQSVIAYLSLSELFGVLPSTLFGMFGLPR